MDPLIDYSSSGELLLGYREENRYRNSENPSKTLFPDNAILEIPPLAYIDEALISEFDDLHYKLKGVVLNRAFLSTLKDLDVFKRYFKYDKYTKNNDYYTLKSLNASYEICSPEQRVMSNNPKSRVYFKELRCKFIYINYLETQEEVKSFQDGSWKTDPEIKPYDKFILESISTEPGNDQIINLDVRPLGIDQRWSTLNSMDKEKFMDLVIIEETFEGRTYVDMKDPEDVSNLGMSYRQEYDSIFSESMLYFLKVLKDGGNAIVEFSSLGSRNVGEWIYLYTFLFQEIILLKPLASDIVGYNHHLVAKGFKRAVFETFFPFLRNILEQSTSIEISSESYIPNPRLVNFEENLNYVAWLTGRNNKICWYILAQVNALIQGLEDRKSKYVIPRPLFDLDPFKLAQSIGDRYITNPTRKLDHMKSLTFQEIKASTTSLTETGQIKEPVSQTLISSIRNSDETLSLDFCIYLGLEFGFIQRFLWIPQESLTEVTRRKQYNKELPNMKAKLRCWLMDMFNLKELHAILKLQSEDPNFNQAIVSLFNSKKDEIYETILGNNSFKRGYLELELFGQSMVDFYRNTHAFFKRSKEFALEMSFKLTLLKNLHYRLSFKVNNIRYALKNNDRMDIITREQLLNVLYPSEKVNFNTGWLDELVKEPKFALRVANYMSMSVFAADCNSSVFFPRFNKLYPVEFEYFGSPWMRISDKWSSNDISSKILGSLGQFNNETSNPDHPIYNDPGVNSALCFSSQNPEILRKVMEKLKILIRGLIAKGKNFKIYFVQTIGDNEIEMEIANLLEEHGRENIKITPIKVTEARYYVGFRKIQNILHKIQEISF